MLRLAMRSWIRPDKFQPDLNQIHEYFFKFLADFLSIGSRSVDPSIFEVPDEGRQNVANLTDTDQNSGS